MPPTKLPDEILLHHIFPLLQSFGQPHLLQQCSLVCRQWFEWSAPLLWSQVYLPTYSKLESFISAIASDTSRLRYGAMVDYLELPQTLIDSVTADMSLCSSIDDFDDNSVMLLDGNNGREMAIVRAVMPLFIRDEFYLTVATKLSKVSAMVIPCCLPSPEQLQLLCSAANCKFRSSLHQLDLGILDRNPSFRHSKGPPDIEDAGLGSLAMFKELRDLRIGSSRLDDYTFPSIVQPMSHLTRLRLDQVHDRRFTDISILQLAKSCPNLRTLNINYVPMVPDELLVITDASVAELAKLCPQLTHLTLFATRITDSSLEALCKHSEYLELLDLSFTPGITMAGLQQTLLIRSPQSSGRRSLRKIIVQSCAQIIGVDEFAVEDHHSGMFLPRHFNVFGQR